MLSHAQQIIIVSINTQQQQQQHRHQRRHHRRHHHHSNINVDADANERKGGHRWEVGEEKRARKSVVFPPPEAGLYEKCAFNVSVIIWATVTQADTRE